MLLNVLCVDNLIVMIAGLNYTVCRNRAYESDENMGTDVTIGLAFIAGFLSFVSPCVLPLVPAYVGYMGGRMTRTVAVQVGKAKTTGSTSDTVARANMLIHGLAFVAGFSVIFVLIGLMTTAFFSVLGSSVSIMTEIIARVGGIMIIFFGLHFMGVIQSAFKRVRQVPELLNNPLTGLLVGAVASGLIVWGFVELTFALPALALLWLGLVAGGAFTTPGTFWNTVITRIELALYADTRTQMQPAKHSGVGGSFLMGVVFSAGWTPCIGPLLGTILTLAASTGNVGQAIPLLTAYSLGLGIPFILTALLLESAQGILRRLQRHMRAIEMASGGFLVLIGVLVASGQLTLLSQSLSTQFADVSARVEECGVGFFEGEVYLHQVGPCLNADLIPVVLNQGQPGEFTDDRTELSYLFHLEEAMSIDVELSKLTDGLAPVVSLLDETDTVLAEGDRLIAIEPDGFYVILSDVELEAGQYRAVITGEYTGDDEEEIEFRLKVRESEPLPEAETGDAPDVVILDTDTSDSDDETATGALAVDGLNTLDEVAGEDGPTYGRAVGDLAFNFTVPTDQDENIDLADLRGDIVILNFWGTWCGPCRREMPELQQIYETYGDQGVRILAVAARDTMQDIRDFREEFDLTFTLALDEDESISDRYGIPGRPSTFILDQDGVIRFQSFSLVTEDQVREVLDALMAE